MNYINIAKWGGIVLVILGLVIAVQGYKSSANKAKNELTLVKIDLTNTRDKLDQQKQETEKLVNDVTTLNNEVVNNTKRYEDVIKSDKEDLAKYRKLLNKCVTPEAVAERLGSLFPSNP